MHRLLEWAPLSGAPAWSSAHLRGVAREFDLLPDEVAQARDAAQRILQGQGAWAWDAAQVHMAESEVEITHQGQLLRIDRLVRRRDTGQWWVLDHKSSAAPQQDAALCGQLRTYRDAVQQALAAQGAAGIATTVIRCAFLSAAGELIELT
jgi:ATP-dependent helicase/nuclease subunit A